jgi:hypothetical protein
MVRRVNIVGACTVRSSRRRKPLSTRYVSLGGQIRARLGFCTFRARRNIGSRYRPSWSEVASCGGIIRWLSRCYPPAAVKQRAPPGRIYPGPLSQSQVGLSSLRSPASAKKSSDVKIKMREM